MIEGTPEHFRPYYEALGELYHAYTDLEHHLTCAVRIVVTEGIKGRDKNAVVYAVLGGMRMSPLKDTIKRLLRVLGAPQQNRDAVDKVFAHLGEIQFLRDRLAHHLTRSFSDPKGATWFNSDFAGVRELEKSTDVEFEVAALTAAATDLHAIKWYLDDVFNDYVQWPEAVKRDQKPFDPHSIPAWQYKPSMLTQRRRKSGGKP